MDEEAFTQSDEQVFCTISIQIETLLDRAVELLLTTNDRTVRPRTPSKIKVLPSVFRSCYYVCYGHFTMCITICITITTLCVLLCVLLPHRLREDGDFAKITTMDHLYYSVYYYQSLVHHLKAIHM